MAVRAFRTTRKLGTSFDEDLRPLFDPRVFVGGLAGGLAQAPLVCALEKLSWAWETQRRRVGGGRAAARAGTWSWSGVLELAAGGDASRARGLARGLGRVAFVDGLGFGVFFAAFEGAKVPHVAHLRLQCSPAALAELSGSGKSTGRPSAR